jgi:uncharacterized phage infection (PIP) family protein YhgE
LSYRIISTAIASIALALGWPLPLFTNMAEAIVALGVASSVISFIQFSQQIANQLRELHAGDVPTAFQDIRMRLPLIVNIISRIGEVAYRLSPGDKETYDTVVESCFKQVRQLDAILQRLTIGKGDSTLRRGFKAAISIAEESRTQKIATALKDNVQLLTYLNTASSEKEKSEERRTSEAPSYFRDSTGVFSVPFIRDSQFVGRNNILLSITEAFGKQNRVAIAGIGGVG